MRYYILNVRIDIDFRRVSYELRKNGQSQRAAESRHNISLLNNEVIKFISIKTENGGRNQTALIQAKRFEQAVLTIQQIVDTANFAAWNEDTDPIDCKDFFLWSLKF